MVCDMVELLFVVGFGNFGVNYVCIWYNFGFVVVDLFVV